MWNVSDLPHQLCLHRAWNRCKMSFSPDVKSPFCGSAHLSNICAIYGSYRTTTFTFIKHMRDSWFIHNKSTTTTTTTIITFIKHMRDSWFLHNNKFIIQNHKSRKKFISHAWNENWANKRKLYSRVINKPSSDFMSTWE
jgi:hypothetical protein